MAVLRLALIDVSGESFSGTVPLWWICDTTAELPTAGMRQGDLVVDKSTNLLYIASSPTALTPVGSPASFATPAIGLGTAAAPGAASSGIRSDATILAFDVGVPTTLGYADAAATGATGVAARRDHRHGMPQQVGGAGFHIFVVGGPGALPTTGVSLGDIGITTSTSNLYLATTTGPVTWTLKTGGTPAGAVTSGTTYGLAPAIGTLLDYARSDHSHGSVAHDSHISLTGVTADQHHATVHGPAQHTGMTFSKNITFFDPAGVAPATLLSWQSPYAWTVTGIRAYRVGGTGATINSYRNTTASPLRSANLSLTSANAWMDGGAVQNTAFAVDDSLLFGLATVTGAVTQVNIQINGTRP